jgi:hypothetical protein
LTTLVFHPVLNPIQVEFDQLVYRSMLALCRGKSEPALSCFCHRLAARRHGLWQFVAHLPFKYVSLPMTWRLLACVYSVRDRDYRISFSLGQNGEIVLGSAPLKDWQEALQDGTLRDKQGFLQLFSRYLTCFRFSQALLPSSTSNHTFMLSALTNLACFRRCDPQSALYQDECAFVQTVALEIVNLCFLRFDIC